MFMALIVRKSTATDTIEANDVVSELQELRKLVLYDQITGLYSMDKFLKKGNSLLEDENIVPGIIVFSVDNLDRISSIYGIEECDLVKQLIGKGLKNILKTSYLYGRVHEDLFAVLMHYDEEDELSNIVNLLTEKITEFVTNAKIEMSFGICPMEDSKDIGDAISKAELAKRTVKSTSLGENYAIFTQDINKRMEEDKKMGDEMDYALEHRQFVMYLQPIVNLRTHEIIAAESLVRWKHPTMGVLSPFKFLPLFEANNFIVKMDHFIWEEACKAIRHWMDNKIQPIPINLNISAIHFDHPKFVETLSSLVAKYKISAEYICLEMPEKIFSEPSDKIGNIMMQLRASGFPICIDNFGSYHSPISFFMNSPVSIIKMDRNFLKNNMMTGIGTTFVRYIYAIASEFGMQVIAEGVEDMDQVIELTDMGCEYAQGFFFSKPIDLREFDILRNNNMKTEYIPKIIYPTFEFEDQNLLP
jgi:EAL domain-containing protein (putative c-di-GMP-specific phosphodiesterase class I)